MPSIAGEYHYFRCDRHEQEGHVDISKQQTYRCQYKGCERPAKCYWYRGEQYADLKPSEPTIAFGLAAYGLYP